MPFIFQRMCIVTYYSTHFSAASFSTSATSCLAALTPQHLSASPRMAKSSALSHPLLRCVNLCQRLPLRFGRLSANRPAKAAAPHHSRRSAHARWRPPAAAIGANPFTGCPNNLRLLQQSLHRLYLSVQVTTGRRARSEPLRISPLKAVASCSSSITPTASETFVDTNRL